MLYLAVMSPWAPIGCESSSDFPDFDDLETVVRITGQVLCRMSP